MIGKMTKGSSFAGAARYDLEKDGSRLIDTNCASSDWNGIASEMDAVAASNTHCKKNCIHLSISAAYSDKLTDDQWRQAGQIVMRELGLEGHQFAQSRHDDTRHDHTHLTINRIGPNGKAWNDSLDYKRVHAAMRVIEKEMGLEQIKDHSATRDGRFDKVKADLAESVKDSKSKGLDHFKQSMLARGYEVIENKSKTTGTIAGVSIQAKSDGKVWKASELQKGGWRSIRKQIDPSMAKQATKQQAQQVASKAGQQVGRQLNKALGGALPKMPGMQLPGMGGMAGKLIQAAMTAPKQKQKGLER